MRTSLAASTTFGDMVGTANFQGHSSAPLHELAKLAGVPANQLAFGFRINSLTQFPRSDHMSLTVYASRAGALPAPSMQDLVAEQEKSGFIRSEEFDVEIPLVRFAALFKEIEIIAVQKGVAPCEIDVP